MFVGAAGFADDLILLAPCRSVIVQMLEKCEHFKVKDQDQVYEESSVSAMKHS